jgi:nicotinate phosphoribosyltransferase
MNVTESPLLTDLYQLNMMQAYLDRGETDVAVFEFFVRKLPGRRSFLVAAGLAQAIDYLERLRFTPEDLGWLKSTSRFRENLLDYLAALRFPGDIDAMPEGTVFFANEPIFRLAAPLPIAQLVETRLVNILNFQTLIASKAVRLRLAAPGKLLVDFGLRRAHGSEAGLLAARASYIGGFAGSAIVLAEKEFGIPAFGTMAHSYIQAHDDETAAFENFARARPDNLTLLIDTFDTEAAARKVVALAPRLSREGISIRAVRIDSGDPIALSRIVRTILDAGGLAGVTIFVSGGLDEEQVAAAIAAGAPIDGFGIGTSLTTSSDSPALDCVYKLQEYAGRPRRKRSTGKETWPGRKQVWRRLGDDGRIASDLVTIEGETHAGEPLIQPVVRNGRRLDVPESLSDIRARAARELARLPEACRRLDRRADYPVEIGASLAELAADVDRREHDPRGMTA